MDNIEVVEICPDCKEIMGTTNVCHACYLYRESKKSVSKTPSPAGEIASELPKHVEDNIRLADYIQNFAAVPEPVTAEEAAEYVRRPQHPVKAIRWTGDNLADVRKVYPGIGEEYMRDKGCVIGNYVVCPRPGQVRFWDATEFEQSYHPAAPITPANNKTLDVERAEKWLAAYHPKLYCRQTAELLHGYSLTVSTTLTPAAQEALVVASRELCDFMCGEQEDWQEIDRAYGMRGLGKKMQAVLTALARAESYLKENNKG